MTIFKLRFYLFTILTFITNGDHCNCMKTHEKKINYQLNHQLKLREICDL